MPPPKPRKLDYRDISLGLQKLRDFLLGRKHHLHVRFPPEISARSQPPPRIPRAPEIKLFNNYYCERNPFQAVQQPVEAPSVLQGLAGQPSGPSSSKSPCEDTAQGKLMPFAGLPSPGAAWPWDGHNYWECPPAGKRRK